MSTTFRLRRIIGTPPALEPGDIVLRATRPLYGPDVDTGLIGFSVVLGNDNPDRAGAIRLNYDLDAEVIEWVSTLDALHEIQAWVEDNYGHDAVENNDDATLMSMWPDKFGFGTREVD